MPQWTDDQRRAITNRNANLLVSAAAGSGKTAVLIQRIISMVLEEHVDIDRLLVLTFTRAAAAEMRQRAAEVLLKKLSKTCDDEAFIRRQLDRLNLASMMTFHSFCRDIIRNHYYLIDVEASFTTADQATSLLLQQETMDDILENAYEESNPAFLKLVEMYCDNRDDLSLQELLLDLYEFSRSHPAPQDWLEQQASKFKAENKLCDSDWVVSLEKNTRLFLENIIYTYEQALEIAQKPSGPNSYCSILNRELETIVLLKNYMIEEKSKMLFILHELEFQRLPSTKETDAALQVTVKNLRNQAKTDIKQLKEMWFFKTVEEFHEDHANIAAPINQLVNLISKFEALYQTKKKERNILDFHDLEHFALRILSFPEARDYYQQHFAGIFIDEYQDSNRVQEALIDKIKQDDNLFMVGDVKQSIYRFRLAEPELFMDKHRTFVDDNESKNQRIDLTKNFRCHPAILEAVNDVFRQIMSESLGEIVYDETAELKAGGTATELPDDMPVNVLLVDTYEKNDQNISEDDMSTDYLDLLEDWSNQELEAKMLTHQVKELLDMKIMDAATNKMRNIQYRDIAILLRAPGNQAPHFVDVFCRENIPVYADLGTGFYKSLEINMVVDMLRILDNMHNDIPLLGVLHSPFGGFSTQQLTDIRVRHRNGSFAEALLSVGEETDELGKTIQQFLKKLERWRMTKRKMSIPDFLWWLLSDTNFFALCAAMPGGQQRQANLRIFIKKSIEFCVSNEGDLYQFIHYIDRIKFNKRSDDGPAKTLNENDNVIRLMSIHKSKGLEFPVVIVAGLGKQFNRRDLQKPLLMHRTLGFGPLYVDPDLRIKRQTLARTAIREKLRLESLSEEMRILYVAMTRAQQRLILSGTVKDFEGKIDKWINSDTEGHRIKASNVLDWLGPVWLKHGIGQLCTESLEMGEEVTEKTKNNDVWDFRVWDRHLLSQLAVEDVEKSKELAHLLEEVKVIDDEKLYNMFNERFSWKYPYIIDTETYTKISVSELSRQTKDNSFTTHHMTQKLNQKPLFITEKMTLSPAEKGTALHYVMQNIALGFVNTINEIKNQINRMLEKEMISKAEAVQIDAEQILRFFNSPIGKRLRQSEKHHRELPFVMEMPGDKNTLVQGIIDCCFVEEGEWVLVDYKTDKVGEDKVIEWSRSYEAQVELYKQALQKTSNMIVKESYLYSFYLDQEVKII